MKGRSTLVLLLPLTRFIAQTHLENHTVRHSDPQVRRHSQQPVLHHSLESQVVGDLVDREEEVLVRCSSDDIGREDELPAERVGVSKQEGGGDLEEDDGKDEVLGGAGVAHEFGDLEGEGKRAVSLSEMREKGREEVGRKA